MSHGIAFFDLDGTLTRRDTYLAYLVGYLASRPSLWPRATSLPAAVALYKMGRRDNTWLKCTFLRTVLGRTDSTSLADYTSRFVDKATRTGLRRLAVQRIESHRRAGDRLVLLTASLDIYAEPIGARLGFDHVLSTRARRDSEGRITGDLDGDNCYGPLKAERAMAYLAAAGAASGTTTFYTDHHSDLPLMRLVTRPVAVNPTPRLAGMVRSLRIPVEDWN